MSIERAMRLIAGALVLATLALGAWANKDWYCLTVVVGASLLQSAFTNWCPMMSVLHKLGVGASNQSA